MRYPGDLEVGADGGDGIADVAAGQEGGGLDFVGPGHEVKDELDWEEEPQPQTAHRQPPPPQQQPSARSQSRPLVPHMLDHIEQV